MSPKYPSNSDDDLHHLSSSNGQGQNASILSEAPDYSTILAISSRSKEPQIGEKRGGTVQELHSDAQRLSKKLRIIEKPSATKSDAGDAGHTQDHRVNLNIDPALQLESQRPTHPMKSPSSTLSSNPYAIYLTNTCNGSAPMYPPFANPYYMTLPQATMSIPGIPSHMHPRIPMMPIHTYPRPLTITRPQSTVSPSTSATFHVGTRPEFSKSPAQFQTANPDTSVSTNIGADDKSMKQPPSAAPSSKPRRIKSHTVVSKSYSIPTIPRDKHGRPMLPLNVGIMTVLHLGTVCTRDHFHSERYIFPVGYTVSRRYLSTLDPSSDVVYYCTILDGGDGPKFQIVTSDEPDIPFVASTATGAWSPIVRKANEIRKRQHSNSVSGPDFFGLGQNTIRHLIQQLPGAEVLAKRGSRISESTSEEEEGTRSRGSNGIYVWQNYIEGGPLGGRHAAVIPALPDEYDNPRADNPSGKAYLNDRTLERDSTSGHLKGVSTMSIDDIGMVNHSPSFTYIDSDGTSKGKTKGLGLSYYPPHVMAQAENQLQPQRLSQGCYYPPHPSLSQPPAYLFHQQSQLKQSSTSQRESPHLQHNAQIQATLTNLLNSLASAQDSNDLTALIPPAPTMPANPIPGLSDGGLAVLKMDVSAETGKTNGDNEGRENYRSRAEETPVDAEDPEGVADPKTSLQTQDIDETEQERAQGEKHPLEGLSEVIT